MQILTRFNKVIAYNEGGYIPVGNSAICTATDECFEDVLIVTVDCVPTDIHQYEYHYIDGKFIKGTPVPAVRKDLINGILKVDQARRADVAVSDDNGLSFRDHYTKKFKGTIVSGALFIFACSTPRRIGTFIEAGSWGIKYSDGVGHCAYQARFCSEEAGLTPVDKSAICCGYIYESEAKSGETPLHYHLIQVQ